LTIEQPVSAVFSTFDTRSDGRLDSAGNASDEEAAEGKLKESG
jgi:hypothetical protein